MASFLMKRSPTGLHHNSKLQMYNIYIVGSHAVYLVFVDCW